MVGVLSGAPSFCFLPSIEMPARKGTNVPPNLAPGSSLSPFLSHPASTMSPQPMECASKTSICIAWLLTSDAKCIYLS